MNLVYSTDGQYSQSGRLDLDRIYSQSLELVLDGAPLAKIIDAYLRYLEQNGTGFRYAVMQAIPQNGTLMLLAAPSLPAPFMKAIHQLNIGENNAACGAAAASKQPYFIDNIASHPNWTDFSPGMGQTGITSCWSFPLTHSGKCIGTLAVTGPRKQSPDIHTISHYQAIAANLSKLFVFCEKQQHKHRRIWELQSESEHQQQQVTTLTASCEKLLAKQSQVEAALLARPLPKGFQFMAASLMADTCEMLNVIKSTLAFQDVVTEQAQALLARQKLDKAALNNYCKAVNRSGKASLDMLDNAQQRLSVFEDYINNVTHNPVRTFSLAYSIHSITQYLSVTNIHQRIFSCLDIDSAIRVRFPVGTFVQIVSELILNVVRHAYPNQNTGQILISARPREYLNKPVLELIIEDKGIGIAKSIRQAAMRPAMETLFTSNTTPRGLSACYQQVCSELGGTMKCDSLPNQGARFVICLPESTN